jgi:hypothetical protein
MLEMRRLIMFGLGPGILAGSVVGPLKPALAKRVNHGRIGTAHWML